MEQDKKIGKSDGKVVHIRRDVGAHNKGAICIKGPQIGRPIQFPNLCFCLQWSVPGLKYIKI